MSDSGSHATPIRSSARTYEVCIVGAGITGLNALVVASTYLSRSDRVALVDRRPRAGGMWVDTYDYVRLHQPHGIFTAGNITWALREDPSHLATKPEVMDHLQRCLDIASKRVGVEEHFGWDYVSHGDINGLVHVTLRSPEGRIETVTAKRLIKAFGHQVTPNRPLETSSGRVRSTTPELLDPDGPELRGDDTPIWIVGGGKTAMDTAHRLITAFPDRKVSMLAGPGVIFARRETFFPTGARRWCAGTPINTMLRQVGQRFDGTNEDEVREWFRVTYGIGLLPDATDFFNAYLSDVELAVITAGLHSIEKEYFSDAVDRDDEVELVFRSGRTHIVPRGTWLVNCTGSLLRTSHPYEPFVSPAATTLSIQMRSSTTGVYPSFAGYFLTHLMFRGQLGGLGLYELDIADLYSKAKAIVTFASMSLALHNLSMISEALPKKVLMDCGLDFDRWYPLPRRIIGVTEFLRTHRRDREHHRRTLDTLGERFHVRSGPVLAA
ncbi:MAG: potassium transporter [Actinobacteria bacterium]|nr:potassium transporter [Actinomycetota bacterium]